MVAQAHAKQLMQHSEAQAQARQHAHTQQAQALVQQALLMQQQQAQARVQHAHAQAKAPCSGLNRFVSLDDAIGSRHMHFIVDANHALCHRTNDVTQH
jgi:hypothetical protein